MVDLHLKQTLWLSVSLNIILGLSTLYYSSRLVHYVNPFIGTELSKEHSITPQNASDIHMQYPIDFENATAVFNSVYGALKQKDSNLSPVGVNFFPAYIPPNTPLYHSRWDPTIPDSFEWLAMDYEFSYSFASFRRQRPRGPEDKPHDPITPGKPGDPKKPHPGFPSRPRGRLSRKDPPDTQNTIAEPRDSKDERPSEMSQAYLLTFKNKKPLNKLIYLDGASAAKTTTGEMDQQLILSQQEDVNAYVDERKAAAKICEWGSSFGLQGVVRLEVGFEIVLCDFHRDLELVSNVSLYSVTDLVGFPPEGTSSQSGLENSRSELIDRWQSMSQFEWLQTGGIVNDGDDRILIDFSNMVTPLNKTWIDPDPYQRRINEIPMELKQHVLADLEKVISEGVDPFFKTNWPIVIDHIIHKFSPMLLDLNNTLTIFDQTVDADLGLALKIVAESLSASTFNFVRRYTDEAIRDRRHQRSIALQHAVEDYLHNTFEIETSSDRLIFSSVFEVTKKVISAIFDIYDLSIFILPDFSVTPTDKNYSEHKRALLKESDTLKKLLKALRWSVFTKCSRSCDWNEVCAVPGWGPGPMGWSFGNRKSLHYENGSFRVNEELQCIGVDDMKQRM